MSVLLNVVLSQAAWFACVLGAAHGLPWAGALVAAGVVGWHLLRARQPGRELALVAAAAAVGAVFDTVLVRAGLVRFDSGVLVQGFAPYWMVALWAVFATTLNVSLRSLRERPALASLLGAAGGPAAYYSGARLGAIEFATVGAALAAIGTGWALLTPALLRIARHLDGYTQR